MGRVRDDINTLADQLNELLEGGVLLSAFRLSHQIGDSTLTYTKETAQLRKRNVTVTMRKISHE